MSGVTRPKVDPGWNDPPTLNFSATNPPPKSRIGNKRIAFPLSGNQSNNSPVKPCDTPMPPLADTQSSHADKRLESVLENINKALSSVDDPTGAVANKFDVMKQMWTDRKFNETMQNNIFHMSKCLAEGNLEKVNECQLQITMENPALCSSWIGGFTQLITYLTK